MRDDVTELLMTEQLQRLALAVGKPFGVAVTQQAGEWTAVFRRLGIPGIALKAGVDDAIIEVKRFPALSDLIAWARPYIPATDGERQGFDARCPQCHGACDWRATDTIAGETYCCLCQYPLLLRYARTEWLTGRTGLLVEAESRRRALPDERSLVNRGPYFTPKESAQ